MVDILASRAASRKLLWIVLSLLLPVVVLAYMLFNAWSEDIEFSRKELQGLEISRHIIPILIGKSMATADLPDQRNDLNENIALPDDNEFDPAVRQQIIKINNSGMEPDEQISAYRDLIAQIGKDSNLLLDPEAESLFLILALYLDIPDVGADYHEQQKILVEALRENGIAPKEYAELAQTTGGLTETVWKMNEAIHQAKESSADKSLYSELDRAVLAIGDGVKAHAAFLGELSFTGDRFVVPPSAATGTQDGVFLKNVEKAWISAANLTQRLIQVRLDNMLRKAYSLGAFGVLSCLLGLGIAVSMFKTTLKRLDDVASARDTANAAKAEAEEMASKLAEINEGTAKLNRDLFENVQKLKAAQDDLVKKGRMEQLGQLTATVAHELRNPLSTVKTSAFLLERKVAGKGLGLEPAIERINNGISRCDSIINELLDFSRSSNIDPKSEEFDPWLLKVVEEQAALLPQSVQIECTLGLGSLQILFDRSRLQRAVINLMSNASEAMVGNGKSPGKIVVGNPIMKISTSRVEDSVEIKVVDNGPGIAPEHMQRIREPLFTTKSFGTGLGIPAIEQIAAQHGGGLEITSTPGQGAAFSIRIPLKKQSLKAA
jgi:signal transduction histidine kinase